MRIITLLKTLAIMALLPLGATAEEVFNYSYFDMTYLDSGMGGTITEYGDRDSVTLNIGEGDGIGLRMSLALNPNVHVFAGYADSNMDVNATHTMSMPTIDEMRSAFLTRIGDTKWDGRCDLTGDGVVNLLDLLAFRNSQGDTRVASYAAVGGDMTDWRVGVGYNAMLTSRIGGYFQMFWDSRDLDLGSALFMGAMKDFGASDHGIGAAVGIRGKVTDRLQLTGRATYTPVGDINMLAATGGDMLTSDTLFGFGGEFWFTDVFSLAAEMEGDGDVTSWLIAARYQLRS